MKTDIAVLGGGASGLAAALSAKETFPKAQVTVVEKLARIGKKIIATGNGKCNLGNVNISEKNYHGSVNTMDFISRTPDCREFFTGELGVLCTVGSEGRTGGIYPRSNSSATVVNALRLKLESLGVEEVCEFEVKKIVPQKDGFTLISDEDEIACNRLIVAAGGLAAPSFGTDGSVLRLLRDMGYKIAKLCPAIAPLRVSAESLKGLGGVRVKADISAVSGGKVLRTESGEIQFNDNNISGICVFNLAYLFGEYEGKLSLRADLMPDMSQKEMIDLLFDIRRNRAGHSAEELLTGIFVRNLAVYLTKKALERPVSDSISNITDSELKTAAALIKSLEFTVTGCSPWQKAQTTMGGIHSSCIGDDLQSKLHKGLYLCGEILDTVGDCGGYNLQWAWSSGIIAGKNCGLSLKNSRR